MFCKYIEPLKVPINTYIFKGKHLENNSISDVEYQAPALTAPSTPVEMKLTHSVSASVERKLKLW